MRGMRRAAAAVATALLLAGCAGGQQPVSSPGSQDGAGRGAQEAPHTISRAPAATPAPPVSAAQPSTAVPSTPEAVVPPAPDRGDCYRLTYGDLPRASNQDRPVSCRSRHTTQTVAVRRLDTVVQGHSLSVDSRTAERQMDRVCHRRMKAYLGGPAPRRHLSRFTVVWFRPTLEQADQGARWFRCDLVALAGGNHLFPLPPPRRLHGVLDGADALHTYGLCGSAAPGSKQFERVICGRKHRWRAFSTIGIQGGEKYPGRSTVRRAGEQLCRSRAGRLQGYSLRFSYGWEWPTRDQWERGQHYGYCWAPD